MGERERAFKMEMQTWERRGEGHKKDGQKAQKIKMRSDRGEVDDHGGHRTREWALEMSTVAPGGHIVARKTGLSKKARLSQNV